MSSIATTNFHNQFGFVHIMFYFYSTLIEIILISATVVEKTIFSIKGAVSIFIIFIFFFNSCYSEYTISRFNLMLSIYLEELGIIAKHYIIDLHRSYR